VISSNACWIFWVATCMVRPSSFLSMVFFGPHATIVHLAPPNVKERPLSSAGDGKRLVGMLTRWGRLTASDRP